VDVARYLAAIPVEAECALADYDLCSRPASRRAPRVVEDARALRERSAAVVDYLRSRGRVCLMPFSPHGAALPLAA
jgi:hypothetical protein